MLNHSEITINQFSYGMTSEELISEGHVDPDYFYDPDEEELKKDIEEIKRIVRENKLPEEEYIEF
ncbi:hypothetical protein [Fischerella thermalis]|uniref:Uncharacterized protein n=1 Tax=Fischerella thermalis CCMEE 5318 TaxID=2019666 RepID=A0A2N6LEN7_9CYAN|nr:hypothetical protein [Fischerella thermalis]PMB21891.1 hypothetical protein CEN46_13585 [Fischerella thermalis CCMEE 5318]